MFLPSALHLKLNLLANFSSELNLDHLLEFSDSGSPWACTSLLTGLTTGRTLARRATLKICTKKNNVSKHCSTKYFSACDPHVKTVLFSSRCLSLYGGVLWNIACNQLKSLEVAFNNILRQIWRLPRNCKYCIKLHNLTVSLIDLSVCMTVSNRKICELKSYLLQIVTHSLYSTPMLLLLLTSIIIQLTNTTRYTLKKTLFVQTL